MRNKLKNNCDLKTSVRTTMKPVCKDVCFCNPFCFCKESQLLRFLRYYKFICGKERKTLQRIELETECQIHIPSQYDQKKDECIRIRAMRKEQISAAKGQIEYEVEKAESKIPMTHFVSIPISLLCDKSTFEVSMSSSKKGHKEKTREAR